MATPRVFGLEVDLAGVQAFATVVRNDTKLRQMGEIYKGMRAAGQRAARYFINRYIANAAGAGGWQELSDERARQKGTDKNENILRESDTLLNNIWFTIEGDTIEVGYVREDAFESHPNADMSIQALAEVHQDGEGKMGQNLPARPIIVPFPQNVEDEIVDLIRQGFRRGALAANRATKQNT